MVGIGFLTLKLVTAVGGVAAFGYAIYRIYKVVRLIYWMLFWDSCWDRSLSFPPFLINRYTDYQELQEHLPALRAARNDLRQCRRLWKSDRKNDRKNEQRNATEAQREEEKHIKEEKNRIRSVSRQWNRLSKADREAVRWEWARNVVARAVKGGEHSLDIPEVGEVPDYVHYGLKSDEKELLAVLLEEMPVGDTALSAWLYPASSKAFDDDGTCCRGDLEEYIINDPHNAAIYMPKTSEVLTVYGTEYSTIPWFSKLFLTDRGRLLVIKADVKGFLSVRGGKYIVVAILHTRDGEWAVKRLSDEYRPDD